MSFHIHVSLTTLFRIIVIVGIINAIYFSPLNLKKMKLIMISIMHAIFTCLIINDSVNSLYVARGGPGNIVMSSAIPLTQIHTSHTIPSSDAVYDLSSSLKRINKKQELNVQTSLIRSKISNRVGKLSIIEKLTFSWVRGLMVVGNKRPLEYSDMWGLSSTDMEQASANFSHYFNIERNNEDSSMSNHINTSTTVSSSTSTSTSDKDTVVQGAPSKGKPNILAEFWQSAITRTIVKMYRKEFIHTGILKFFNTFVQFFPSILISQIVSITDKGTLSNPALRMLGLGYAGLLFAALCAKTFLENQYFDEVINLSSKVKGTLSAAVYKKSLRLSPSSRQNNTVN